MAKNSITDYDNTSSNNTDVQSVDISEGCSPSGINNAIREVMADLADVNDGTVALTSPQVNSLTLNGNATFGDNDKAIFGAGSDLQIFHDGSNSKIADVGTGDLQIFGQNVGIYSNAGEPMFVGIANGQAELYYDNSKKLATTATGIDVTGNITVDSEGGSATTDLRQGSAKAWVHVNMSSFGTTASFNTASVTDVGTGRLEMNTTNAFNAVHQWSAQCTSGASSYNTSYFPDNVTTSKIGMRVRNDALSYIDTSYNMMTVVGDLA